MEKESLQSPDPPGFILPVVNGTSLLQEHAGLFREVAQQPEL